VNGLMTPAASDPESLLAFCGQPAGDRRRLPWHLARNGRGPRRRYALRTVCSR